jgi:hypothetical protein
MILSLTNVCLFIVGSTSLLLNFVLLIAINRDYSKRKKKNRLIQVQRNYIENTEQVLISNLAMIELLKTIIVKLDPSLAVDFGIVQQHILPCNLSKK